MISTLEFLLIVIIGSVLVAAILLGPVLWMIRIVARAFLCGGVERGVVSQIASVVRQNLPLATGVSLAADSEHGLAASYLRQIARLLGQGLPLSEAVAKGFRGCSSRTLSLIAAGECSGQLSVALDAAESRLLERWRHGMRPGANAMLYLLAMLGATSLVVGFLMVGIIPKYVEIFKDYGAVLPSETRTLIAVCSWLGTGTPPGGLLVLLLASVILFLWARPRRWGTPRWATQVADAIRWHLPGLHRLTQGQDMNLVLETMRQAVDSGMNLPQAAAAACDLDVNTCLRRKMRRFAETLETGTSPGQAAVNVGLGKVTAMALANGERTGRMSESLRFAADYHYALVSRLWCVVRNLAVPVATLCAATFVGWTVIAMFKPLISLIDAACSI
ncbi:MAG TPA: type II secretion system F family protein [Phycisphaerae bacterium]|nr:type II secretion system F family protein [Phycisphaerae bacterium]HRY67390.1 type II secretion system F family protein [Phycisphaerae bacterium]HSA29318.1 type II secretion system F family protein [Phycisphaerae bacterium]